MDASSIVNTAHVNTSQPRRGSKHACERCRTSKVRCLLDTLDQHKKCRRCFEANIDCVFLSPAPRQKRRQTDARVASLEKELSAMRTVFDHLQPRSADRSSATVQHQTSDQTERVGEKSPHITDAAEHQSDATCNSVSNHEPFLVVETSEATESSKHGSDIIPGILGPGIISHGLARKLHNHFVDDILPLHPVIALDTDQMFVNLRSEKPILLLAMISAASATGEPGIYQSLHTCLIKLLADKVVINGEKSLELIQAILVMEAWYYPPNDLKQLNFYQWIHIAGTMAMQIGIGGRVSPEDMDNGVSAENLETKHERLRTMFAVFITCSSVAISLRRQPMISFTPQAQAKLEAFVESAFSRQDKQIAACLKLQLLAEDIEKLKINTFRDQQPDYALSATEINHIQMLQNRFDEWQTRLEPGLVDGYLLLHLLYCKAQLFELALCRESMVELLSPPFLDQGQMSPQSSSQNTTVDTSYVKALICFINGCHAILDQVLAIEPHVLCRYPTVAFTRILYCIKALVILEQALSGPGHYICQILDHSTLRLDFYILQISKHLDLSCGTQKRRVPTMILDVLGKIAAQRNTLAGYSPGSSPANQHFRPRMDQALEASSLNQNPEGYTSLDTPRTSRLQHELGLPLNSTQLQGYTSMIGNGAATLANPEASNLQENFANLQSNQAMDFEMLFATPDLRYVLNYPCNSGGSCGPRHQTYWGGGPWAMDYDWL